MHGDAPSAQKADRLVEVGRKGAGDRRLPRAEGAVQPDHVTGRHRIFQDTGS
ncbi:MAG: hypothetical protein OXG04_20655 [Acidobacteria bacterium]|nr:hypothetical protein [Acidobacteriota bacterium]